MRTEFYRNATSQPKGQATRDGRQRSALSENNGRGPKLDEMSNFHLERVAEAGLKSSSQLLNVVSAISH